MASAHAEPTNDRPPACRAVLFNLDGVLVRKCLYMAPESV